MPLLGCGWRARTLVAAQRAQTPLQRRRDYWRDVLTRKDAAAEVRLFDLARYAIDQWRAAATQIQSETDRIRLGSLLRELPATVAHTALFALGGIGLLVAAQEARLSPGTFVGLLLAIQQFLDLMQNFSRVDKIYQVFAELAYVPAILAWNGDEVGRGASAPPLAAASIRFRGVSFSYPDSSHLALADVDVTIRPGERVALVGENGAGKSTFARLLLGLYPPTTGAILVDGIDLQQIDPTSWRRQVAAVFQDYMCYVGTVRDNIGYGQVGLLNDDDAIQAAARKSGADAIVAQLPHSYETLLGKELVGAVDLSGGQWQKFAIARAYLRDAALLVLDEPAAALDAFAEQEVYRQFVALSAGKTVLLISHRLGAARLADRILFLQSGRIVQQGTHDELMRSGGPYAELYALQAAWYRD